MTHLLRSDFRKNSLETIIQGLVKSIAEQKDFANDSDWYCGDIFLEHIEPLFGIGFIALQNYINSSIYDIDNSLKKMRQRYKEGNKIGDSGKTDIELFIGLANYFKHRDDEKDFRPKTKELLDSFNFTYDIFEVDSSPIFLGMDLISKEWDLMIALEIVIEWREAMWAKLEE